MATDRYTSVSFSDVQKFDRFVLPAWGTAEYVLQYGLQPNDDATAASSNDAAAAYATANDGQ